ncbi:MAG: type II toxin-antitoxin system HicB family antitoxin [Acetobacteraceae bacterium]|jgi:predicted RNase H-like HicB family nuclease
MTAYIALLRKQPGSDYGVDFPDFPGCITAGRTLEEARRMAGEALAFHVDGMREDDEPIPPPSSMDAIMADPLSRDAIAFLVDLPEKSRRAVRINVSLPEDIVQSIDRVSANRSRFLADAARDRLKRQRKSA